MHVQLKLTTFCTALIFSLASIITNAQAKPNIKNLECPTCNGLTEISENVFTDAPQKAVSLNKIVSRSRQTTAAFFGRNMSKPKIVLCTSNACTKIFVKRMGRGHSIADAYILLSPSGANQTILTHELVHAEIYKRLAFTRRPTLMDDRIPTWFNEGLATYLSEDARYSNNASKRDLKYALKLENMQVWKKHVTLKKYKRGYEGAKSLVANLDKAMTRKELKKIVDLIAFGGLQFDTIVGPYMDLK